MPEWLRMSNILKYYSENELNFDTSTLHNGLFSSAALVPDNGSAMLTFPYNDPEPPTFSSYLEGVLLNTVPEDNRISIFLNNNFNVSSFFDNKYNLVSALFHEIEHVKKDEILDKDAEECRVYSLQVQQPDFLDNCTEEFKIGILNSKAEFCK